MRSRWAAVGAAVAVTLGAGGISLGQAAIGTGDKPVFVAVTPCRLVDTRPGSTNIGSRTTPLGPGDTLTLQITGSTGQCSGVPAGATAAAMNVTAVQGSTRSYLSVYPADAALPNASNLNWNGGDPPTPNKVDVKLSSGGAVKITNDAGTVHVAADLVGYYLDHTHDDRYYTEDETDAALAGKADAADTYTKSEVYTQAEIDAKLPPDASIGLAAGAFTPSEGVLLPRAASACFRSDGSSGSMRHSLPIVAGSTVTSIDIRAFGAAPDAPFDITVWAQRPGTSSGAIVHTAALSATMLLETTIDVPDEVIDPGEVLYLTFTGGSDDAYLCAATVHFRQPG